VLGKAKEWSAEKRLVSVDTPRSLAISAVGLSITVGGLYFLPSLNAGPFKTWASLSLGAVGIAMLRAARNAMKRRPEIDNEELSDDDRRLKAKLKLLLYTLGFAWFGLLVIAIDDFTAPRPHRTLLVDGPLVVLYVVMLALGYIYKWKFVSREKP
jgi:hypothetical protein